MNRLMYFLATALMLALSNPGVASIRCRPDLIQKGNSVVLLIEACGEPDIGSSDILLGYGSGEVTLSALKTCLWLCEN